MLRMKLNGTFWEYLDTITYLYAAAASTHSKFFDQTRVIGINHVRNKVK
jgi:hypothetical protein